MRSRSLVAWFVLLVVTLAISPTTAQDETIRIMIAGDKKIIYLPATLAAQLGYFREEGLDVELLTDPAGVEAEDELLSGAVQGVVGFYDHTIDLQSKGQFVESVVQLGRAPGEAELVSTRFARTITSPSDFRGRRLGVTALGSSTNFLTQYIAAKHGIEAGAFTPVTIGAGDSFIAALRDRRIDGGMTTEPTVSRLLQTGEAKIIVDMRTARATQIALGAPYPGASLYLQTAWIERHHTATQKLTNAFVKALRFIATHSGREIADKMPPDYYAGSKALYIKALTAEKAVFTRDGRMPQGGPRSVLAVLAAFNGNVKREKIDLSRTYTAEFVDAADAE